MWFFKSKDLRDYSCDFKNSKRFWKFSENAGYVFFVFRFWLSELHEPAHWKCCLSLKIIEIFKISNPKISGNIHAISKILEDPETSAKMLDILFVSRFWLTEPHKRAPWSFCLSGSDAWTSHAKLVFTIDFRVPELNNCFFYEKSNNPTP